MNDNLSYMEEGNWNALRKSILQFILEGSGVVVERMWTRRLFHARGADTLNARSQNFSLVRGMNRCSLLTDRRIRRELSPETGCSNFDMYSLCTRRHSLYCTRASIGSQCNSIRPNAILLCICNMYGALVVTLDMLRRLINCRIIIIIMNIFISPKNMVG